MALFSYKQFLESCKNLASGTMDFKVFPDKDYEEGDQVFFNSEGEVKEKYQEILQFFEYELDDPIKIYRFIGVDSKAEINKKAPGSHWTYSTENWNFLISNFVEKKVTILISGEISKNKIDWKNTIEVYTLCSMIEGPLGDSSESELFIDDNNQKFIQDVKYKIYKQ